MKKYVRLVHWMLADWRVCIRHPIIFISFYYWLGFKWFRYVDYLNRVDDPYEGLASVRQTRGKLNFHYPEGDITNALITICNAYEVVFQSQIERVNQIC